MKYSSFSSISFGGRALLFLRNIRFFSILCLLFIGLLNTSCKKGCQDITATNYDPKAKKDDGSCQYATVSRKEMLTHIGNNIIIPRYLKLKNNLEELKSSIESFTNAPTTTTLADAQSKHKTAWISWQKCSVFELGPAENLALRANTNTYPTDTIGIETNISSGNYTISSFTQVQRKGFPALDYLLNNGSDATIVSNYSSNNRRAYLLAVVNDLVTNVNSIYSSWIEGEGNYIQTFVAADGTDISSSLGLLVNQFNQDYELVKNAKLGAPLGKPLTTAFPEQVEALYSGSSTALAQQRLTTLYDLYLGVDENNSDGESLDDYLIALENATLSKNINEQFGKAITAMQAVPDTLSQAVINNYTLVDAAYEEIKKLIVFIKTDMATEMEVSITYNDGDGD